MKSDLSGLLDLLDILRRQDAAQVDNPIAPYRGKRLNCFTVLLVVGAVVIVFVCGVDPGSVHFCPAINVRWQFPEWPRSIRFRIFFSLRWLASLDFLFRLFPFCGHGWAYPFNTFPSTEPMGVPQPVQ